MFGAEEEAEVITPFVSAVIATAPEEAVGSDGLLCGTGAAARAVATTTRFSSFEAPLRFTTSLSGAK